MRTNIPITIPIYFLAEEDEEKAQLRRILGREELNPAEFYIMDVDFYEICNTYNLGKDGCMICNSSGDWRTPLSQAEVNLKIALNKSGHV